MREHLGDVYSVCYSPDGNYIASGGEDLRVCLWNVKTGKLLAVLKGGAGYVYSVCFSPDGKHVVSGTEDKMALVWNVQTYKCVWKFKGHHDRVWSVIYSPDGKHVVSASHDKTIRIWDVETGQCVSILQDRLAPSWWQPSDTIQINSPDGKYSACRDFNVVRIRVRANDNIGLSGALDLTNCSTVGAIGLSPSSAWLFEHRGKASTHPLLPVSRESPANSPESSCCSIC